MPFRLRTLVYGGLAGACPKAPIPQEAETPRYSALEKGNAPLPPTSWVCLRTHQAGCLELLRAARYFYSSGRMTMKRVLIPLLLALLLALTGCGTKSTEKTELTVFAAASMTETLTELGSRYMEANETVTIIFNFDSSGTLKTQIEEGADCDLFISAGQKQMDGLTELLLPGSRLDILENKVALVVPEGNPAGITSYAALADALAEGRVLLAMGNADVPVGQYTQRILTCFGLEEQALASAGVITYGSNVKEIATQVREDLVDCGIVYQTDAASAGLTVVDTATADLCGQVIYPAAVMNASKHTEAAQAFLDYLTSDEADAVFEAVGFTPIG